MAVRRLITKVVRDVATGAMIAAGPETDDEVSRKSYRRSHPRQAHDAIGFLNSQWLSLGLAMPLRPLGNDKSPDLLLREALPLDIDQRSQRNATMNEAGKIGLRGHHPT